MICTRIYIICNICVCNISRGLISVNVHAWITCTVPYLRALLAPHAPQQWTRQHTAPSPLATTDLYVSLVEFMYLVFTRKPGKSYHR